MALVLIAAWAFVLAAVVSWEKGRGFGANMVVASLLAAFVVAFVLAMAYVDAHVRWVP